MRRNSVIDIKNFNSSELSHENESITPSISSRRYSSIYSGVIKRTGSYNKNLKDIILGMKKYRKTNTKNKFVKESKFKNVNKNQEDNEIKNNLIVDYIDKDNDYNNDKKISIKIKYYQKLIYKKVILDKYSKVYLNIKPKKNEKSIKESEKPKIFNLYIINNLFLKKKCRLTLRYSEILKFLDGKDYLIGYYEHKQSYLVLKYLFGCIYNNDKYTINKIIDNRNNYEIIVNYYQTIMQNMIEFNNINKNGKMNFMINEYLSKINKKDYKYYFNKTFYKYLFIGEVPYFSIPNNIPNYLWIDDINKKNILRQFLHKYKFTKIKSRYNLYLEDQSDYKDNNKNNIKRREKDDIDDEKEEFETENTQMNYYYNNNFIEKSKRSFILSKEKEKEKNYTFISFGSEEQFPSFIYNNNDKDYFFFNRHGINNNIDKRIKNDIDILEVEKILENFGIDYTINNQEKEQKKINNIKNNKPDKNNILNTYLSEKNIYKKQKIDIDIKRNEQKKFLTFQPKKIKIDEEEIEFPPLITKKSKKEEVIDVIDSYNDKEIINSLSNSINNTSKINKNNNNNIDKILLKPNSFREEKKLKLNDKNKKIYKPFDFKNTIYKIISNKNFSLYNKKYKLKLKSQIKKIEKKPKQKEDIKSITNNKKKFKDTIDFIDDSIKNKILLNKKNKLLCCFIVENQFRLKNLNEKDNNSNESRTLTYNNKIQENNNNIELRDSLAKMKYMYNKIKKKRNEEKMIKDFYFKNAKTSREVLKFGDIYF